MRHLITRRARFLAAIRAFFAARGVLEVDTAQLRPCGVTDPQLVSLAASGGYLQTSPEYVMKILLAQGAGETRRGKTADLFVAAYRQPQRRA